MRLAAFATIAALGACAPYPPNPPPGPPTSENQCRAADYRYLVGRHRSDIPPQPAGAAWRVTCSSCPVTMDYNPYRLNIFYDERTGIVGEVRCG